MSHPQDVKESHRGHLVRALEPPDEVVLAHPTGSGHIIDGHILAVVGHHITHGGSKIMKVGENAFQSKVIPSERTQSGTDVLSNDVPHVFPKHPFTSLHTRSPTA